MTFFYVFSTLPPKKSRGKPALSKVPFLETVNGDSDYTGPGKMMLLLTSTLNIRLHMQISSKVFLYWRHEVNLYCVCGVLFLSGYAVYRKRCRTRASGPRVGQVQRISVLPCSGERWCSAAFQFFSRIYSSVDVYVEIGILWNSRKDVGVCGGCSDANEACGTNKFMFINVGAYWPRRMCDVLHLV